MRDIRFLYFVVIVQIIIGLWFIYGKISALLSSLEQVLFFIISFAIGIVSIVIIIRLLLNYDDHTRSALHEREQFEREISHRENLLCDLSFRVATSIPRNDNTHDSEYHEIINRLYTNLRNCLSRCFMEIFDQYP